MMDLRLHMNLDAVVSLRGRRGTAEPEPAAVAMLAELAGVHGLSISRVEERRELLDRDVRLLREIIRTRLNLRLVPGGDLAAIAFDTRPQRITLISEPQSRQALPSGLDVNLLKDALRKHFQTLRDADIEVAVHILPDLDQVKAAHRVSVDVIELDAVGYTAARTPAERRVELVRLVDAATTAARLGMRVALSGGLDLRSAEELSRLTHASELHVGHDLVARSVLVGVERAVGDFLQAMARGRQRPL
ncbi:MAG: pyridoxine 5'-phosphate synthase [Myxococcales bacterium]|nr:pyridoxine 5'-phosphate synthase [Myxococcales bacterium]